MAFQKLKASAAELLANVEAFHAHENARYKSELVRFRQTSLDQCDSLPIIRPADSWTVQNTLLNTYLHDFRSQCLIIGNTSVKVALLVTHIGPEDVSGPEASSLLNELEEQLRTLFSIFCRCAECALSHALHNTVVRGIASLLTLMQEVISNVETKATKRAIEGSAGMVLQLSEDLQKMPITNKIAYRRLIMEKCLAVKETTREFQSYLDEREANANKDVESEGEGEDESGSKPTVSKDDEEDENDEEDEDVDEDDERDYTEQEAVVVAHCVQLMLAGQELLKLSLVVVTSVGDVVLTSADTAPYSECFAHIARVIQAVEVLENDLTDLGAELYPPVEIVDLKTRPDSTLGAVYTQAHGSVLKLLALLQNTKWSVHVDELVREKMDALSLLVQQL